ncbi:AraC family transcriptional regulator [Thiospirochaeta perfilievii]|uniref:AraC family transcriptional regulator n=1 Tax=Thiospirochaeta perfilievii TaxID=252967 RepID=A0A5C1QDG0_9SPIO|nr:AraC family transcriptional regulator [Thiospirochaeta perfilievii]QEN04242.1 AraC family transcriptional regulator [Thiospirochaeta perfilievii]
MIFKIEELVTFGRSQCSSGYEFGGLRNYYVLHFVINGKGEYKVGKKTWRLKKGNAFLIRPNESHLYKADENEPWEYLWVCFTGDISTVLKNININENNLCSDIEDFDRVLDIYSKLKEPTKLQKIDDILSNIGLTYMLLSLFAGNSSKVIESQIKTRNVTKNHVFGMSCFIEQNFMNPISVSDVINFIQLDRSYASTLYKKEKNISIYDDIQERRIEKAVKLLKTSYSIKEITYICGFKSYQNFITIFKKRFGLSPREYKKHMYLLL